MAQAFFRASWDRTVLFVTLFFSLVIVGTPLFVLTMYFIVRSHGGPATPVPVCVAIVLWVLYFVALIFAPRGYVLTADELRVVRIVADIHVKLADILQVEVVEYKKLFRGAFHTGSGGAFGIYGRFYSDFLPEFQAYVTRTGRLVMMRRKHDVPLVISPDDIEGFLRQIAEAGVAVGQ